MIYITIRPKRIGVELIVTVYTTVRPKRIWKGKKNEKEVDCRN